MGIRVEPLEKGLPVDCGAPKIRCPYAQFVREVWVLYSLGYARTIQTFSMYSTPGMYECILL